MKMQGKTVIVTGGGRGIGFGIATAFAREGANIAITNLNEQGLEEAKKALEGYGAQVLTVVADGADERAVASAVKQTADRFGGIDVVVNNAQASKSGVLLVDHTTADFELALHSGLYAAFYYMRAAFPYLKRAKGLVINLASGAGLSGKSGQSSYAAAKEGIRGLSRVAATEWGEFGVRVNVVCPLVMTQALEQWSRDYPQLYRDTIKHIPLQRFGDAEKDIGRLCVFLASEDASYITGQTIEIQGGTDLRP
ncbi:SDR family NAD(P)-dependent oxidoreductase [Anaerotruncus massiliensis (ex Togo et al. 2019)]|uniref:SDR family NAD(P)-dependent oxidoreductase n=1 Tax=Anaerotruncus TaxID=244127 RepID=UPI000C77EDAA|nr:SDR family NAD(P)-dependent oxidoreductase [Anaerotruncus massiliensis (ex Togo et al. 2019)]